jgi:hypothetical protein
MPEISQEQYGNILMLVGGVIAALAAGWPKISEYLKVLIPSGNSKESITTLEVHEMVDILIDNRNEVKDEEGVMLMVAFGKHIYDFEAKEKEV